MSGIPDSEAQKIMGTRLQIIREALGLTQEDMADKMGVVMTTMSAWENGRNQIDIVKLARAATRWGFTTDWVARGDLSGLRKDLADKVESIVANEPVPRRGRPSSRSKFISTTIMQH
jgi:transcriptional regulator with XRE-family HTH domain